MVAKRINTVDPRDPVVRDFHEEAAVTRRLAQMTFAALQRDARERREAVDRLLGEDPIFTSLR